MAFPNSSHPSHPQWPTKQNACGFLPGRNSHNKKLRERSATESDAFTGHVRWDRHTA